MSAKILMGMLVRRRHSCTTVLSDAVAVAHTYSLTVFTVLPLW